MIEVEASAINGEVNSVSSGHSGAKAWSPSKILQQVSFEASLDETQKYGAAAAHAVHCFLWATVEEPLLGLDKDKAKPLHPRAAILMQLRFDGHAGFSGGLVDDSLVGRSVKEAQEIVVSALNRELVEESNYDVEKNPIRQEDYLFTHHSIRQITTTPIFNHFFAYKMSLADMCETELRSLTSSEHGREVLGNFRVPLFTMSDGYRGFPAFLDNNFIGNSRQQLIDALIGLAIMSKEEVSTAMNASNVKS